MEKTYYCIGMMSGTSLDGVDLVHARITSGAEYAFEILACKTYAYPEKWLSKLKDAFSRPARELQELDRTYGCYLGKLVREFRKEFEVSNVDFIASHGHTIFHQPDKHFTLQIGCGAEIARTTGCVVIADFRTQDVALGGQGAPLVPIGDALLFSDYTYCLNLGGFANISFEKNGVRKAFDLCPVNSVLNFYANQIGFDFDDKGQLAARGKVATPLLDALNSVPFYRLPPPKSLGFEFVASKILPLMDSFSLRTEDLLCTFVEHVAVQVSKELVSLGDSKALVTGGGAYHTFLMERIQAHTEVVLVLPSSQLVEFKEALIFGLLGLLKLEDKPNCLQSVTGAFKDHSSGKVEWP